MVMGGEPVVTQAFPNPAVIADEEILLQFAEALTTDTTALRILGPSSGDTHTAYPEPP
jgi:hypothetical protein